METRNLLNLHCFLSSIFCRDDYNQNSVNMDPEALKNLSPAQKEEIMTAVQQQVALANMQVSL